MTWRTERERQLAARTSLADELRLTRVTARELQILLRLNQEENRQARIRARQERDNLAKHFRGRLERLTSRLKSALAARRETLAQVRDARRGAQQLQRQLAESAAEGQRLTGALAAVQDRLAASERTVESLRANVAAERERAGKLTAHNQRLTLRVQVQEARLRRLDERLRFAVASLQCREEEVRYRLGDALVRALHPSRDTLVLPWRLVQLFRDGLRRRRDRRRGIGAPVWTQVSPPATVPPSPAPGATAEAELPSVLKIAEAPAAVVPQRQSENILVPAPAPPSVADRMARARSSVGTGRATRGYLFFCVNGAGLGHVTRSLAIARRIRRLEPEARIYFLSSSQALDVISREGMVAYHIPPHSRFGDSLRSSEWSTLLAQQIQLIVDTHQPSVFVYDGVFPYRGVLEAIEQCQFVHTAMVLRLRHKHDRVPEMAEKLTAFNELIFPGEAGTNGDISELVPPELAKLPCRMVDPIVYLDREELLPREQVRAKWNVPPDKKLVYVQLGAGNINDIQALTEQIVSILAPRKDVAVVLAESPIAERVFGGRADIRVLRHYPNSLYCNGFDLAITAVGYNTFHEQMHFGVPSVLIPNQETRTDDQARRAMTAHRALAAIAVLRPEDLAEAIALGLTDEVAATAREKALALVPSNGALVVAQCLVGAAQPALVPA
jgi:UDP:flavonoid glycosyltransferase YjiC (YdhE family)